MNVRRSVYAIIKQLPPPNAFGLIIQFAVCVLKTNNNDSQCVCLSLAFSPLFYSVVSGQSSIENVKAKGEMVLATQSTPNCVRIGLSLKSRSRELSQRHLWRPFELEAGSLFVFILLPFFTLL